MLTEEMALCRAHWNNEIASRGTWIETYCDVPRDQCCAGGRCAPCPDDGDGLPYFWELMYGLDPRSAQGTNGADGDPDGDGLANLVEFKADSHPRGFHRRYLAEGATGSFFSTRLALLAAPGQVSMNLKFLRADGKVVTGFAWLTNTATPGKGARGTLDVAQVKGMTAAEFATVIESNLPVVVDRTMKWGTGHYGSHAETSLLGPAATWYLAEGATHSGFDLFYLIQNPSPRDALVKVRYLLPSGPPLEKLYVVAANSRFNIWVNREEIPGTSALPLASTDVSAVLSSTNGVGILVERAMYLSGSGRLFDAGHDSAGIRAPATSWILAEGATGEYFDLFVLIANPNDTPAEVRATYLLPGGQTLARTFTAPPNSRSNIWVNEEVFPGTAGRPLADTAVSTRIDSLNGVPLIVERAMWWPGETGWREAHASPGVIAGSYVWALAEGESGGPDSTETYVLIANLSAVAGAARVSLIYEDGSTEERQFELPASSRTTIAPVVHFPKALGRRYGVAVEAVPATTGRPWLVVERAMYSGRSGSWDAGTAAAASGVPDLQLGDGRTCVDACATDYDCGIPAGECSRWAFCGDYVGRCNRGNLFAGTCNTCQLLWFCGCSGPAGASPPSGRSTVPAWPFGPAPNATPRP